MINSKTLFYIISIIIQLEIVLGQLQFINSTTHQSLDPITTEKIYNSIFANFQSQDLVSFSPTTFHVGPIYPFGVIFESKCSLSQKLIDDLSQFSSRSDIFLLVKRSHIIEHCIHVSKFAIKVQSLLPQVQGLLIDVSSALIPGYFSSESYKYPGEDTSNLFLVVYEFDTKSFNSIVSETKSHFESNEGNSMLVASITPSINLWSEMYSNPGFLAYRYIFLTSYLIVFMYVTICLVAHLFFLSRDKKKLTAYLLVVFITNFFYSLERLIHYCYDPFMVKSEQVITGFTVMYYVAVWLGFMSYTALSFMYVRIVRNLTECFIWKYRYHLWFFVIMLLPLSITCILVRFFLGSGVSNMIHGAYITILTLFESIVLIYNGRKVLVLIRHATKAKGSEKNEVYKKITILVIFSSILFLLILIVSFVLFLSETWIVKTPTFFVVTQALLDTFAGALCVSMVSTLYGFRSAPTTSDNSKSSTHFKRKDHAEMSIS